MAKGNRLILEKANSAIIKNDHEGFFAFCTDDTTWTFEGDMTIVGKANIIRWMQASYSAPPDSRLII